MSAFASLTKSAAALGALVVALAIAAVSSWVTRRAVEREATTVTDTVRVGAPLAPSEIVDATMPDQVTQYDTSETRTECIQVPTWLTRSTTDASSKPAPASDSVTLSGAMSERLREFSSETRGARSGPPYVTIPAIQGSPSLSVGSSEVTLSGYLPSGEGRQWTYDLPTDRWGVGLKSDFTFSQWAQVTTTAGITRHAEWGPLNVSTRFGAGYGFLVRRQSVQAAPVVQSSFELTYNW